MASKKRTRGGTLRQSAAPATEPRRPALKRRHLIGPGQALQSLEVFCPSQETTVPAERCAECGFLVKFPEHPGDEGAAVECEPPGTRGQSEARRSPRIDMAEAAARAPLGEVVRRSLVCVRSDTSLEQLMTLIAENDVDSLPVVDSEWRPIGIVSKGDLVRGRGDASGHEGRVPGREGRHIEARPGRTVADLMTPLVHSLPEDARLAHAVSLMAEEGIHQVPILTKDGNIVGMISSMDCIRWMARQMGWTTTAPDANGRSSGDLHGGAGDANVAAATRDPLGVEPLE